MDKSVEDFQGFYNTAQRPEKCFEDFKGFLKLLEGLRGNQICQRFFEITRRADKRVEDFQGFLKVAKRGL